MSRYFFITSMSSFLAVSLSSLMIVIILSSTACIVLFISFSSVCSAFISAIAFLWLLSMFCSTTRNFLRSSLYLSSPTLSLAVRRFICSVAGLVSGGGGVFGPNKPFFAGAGASGSIASVSFAIVLDCNLMVNVYILKFNLE